MNNDVYMNFTEHEFKKPSEIGKVMDGKNLGQKIGIFYAIYTVIRASILIIYYSHIRDVLERRTFVDVFETNDYIIKNELGITALSFIIAFLIITIAFEIFVNSKNYKIKKNKNLDFIIYRPCIILMVVSLVTAFFMADYYSSCFNNTINKKILVAAVYVREIALILYFISLHNKKIDENVVD